MGGGGGGEVGRGLYGVLPQEKGNEKSWKHDMFF